ncbi:hypothetical protein FRX31_014405 [Thalictrum thalictroides]|uniref:Uncharacterized protein n=1 Tax=Thalictrum thalictroides TaxID=46969 RepID=A0A7J6WGG9_THATH|nr:hypothetical protein FRX31_014405 [Thalictrum thalictroides]
MGTHDSDKDGPSPSRPGRSALPPTHTHCCQKDGDSSSPLGRSSLTLAQLATVRSEYHLWYRLRRDRLSAEPFRTDHQPHGRQRPQLTHTPISQTQPRSVLQLHSSYLPAHFHCTVIQFRLTFFCPSLEDASNVGRLLPRPDMTAHLQHHLHLEVRRLGISSSDISVNSHTNSINIDFP